MGVATPRSPRALHTGGPTAAERGLEVLLQQRGGWLHELLVAPWFGHT